MMIKSLLGFSVNTSCLHQVNMHFVYIKLLKSLIEISWGSHSFYLLSVGHIYWFTLCNLLLASLQFVSGLSLQWIIVQQLLILPFRVKHLTFFGFCFFEFWECILLIFFLATMVTFL